MRMEIREQNKIVELWLTREERDDSAFRESLKPIYQQYKGKISLLRVMILMMIGLLFSLTLSWWSFDIRS